MNERCPACALKFEREPGYFVGAMYISYPLALLTMCLIGAALWSITSWPISRVLLWAFLLLLPLAPLLSLFARVLWIYLDQKLDPDTSSS